eukprot:4656622-Alexandrium_andersonii.AAC.1
MTGYAQVAAADIPEFERKSGGGGVFVRCIARHRPSEAAAHQPVRWLPRNEEEEGPAYLARALGLAEERGLACRRGGNAALGI